MIIKRKNKTKEAFVALFDTNFIQESLIAYLLSMQEFNPPIDFFSQIDCPKDIKQGN